MRHLETQAEAIGCPHWQSMSVKRQGVVALVDEVQVRMYFLSAAAAAAVEPRQALALAFLKVGCCGTMSPAPCG